MGYVLIGCLTIVIVFALMIVAVYSDDILDNWKERTKIKADRDIEIAKIKFRNHEK